MSMEKVIIDTDIGDDIDDALALALALQMPEIDLIGVTTAFLDTVKRARIANRLLKLWKREVPVWAGMRLGNKGWQNGSCCAGSLIQKPDIDGTPCQYTKDLETGEYEPLNDSYRDGGQGAVDFIIDSAKKYGKELTLVMIGPMTNGAEAILQCPEIMRRIKRIVVMGGCFQKQFCEWNVYCDPESADVIERSGIDVTWIGTDVTFSTRLNDAQQQMLMHNEKDEKHRYLSSLVRAHFAYTHRNAVLHDPLTLYYVIHPEIVATEPVLMKVDLNSEHVRGMTVNYDSLYSYLPSPLPGRRQTVGKTVDAEAFLQAFFSLLGKEDTTA